MKKKIKKEKKISLQAAIRETVPQCDIEEANKSTSPQATGNRKRVHKLRAQA